ncbi:Hypothetical predicted protein [Octopus vulgaris]|uniref:Uncharacterized protein n=1 Tax=Octopus vulgaris TaxID=6645 RepID=A0AA36C330_OCTVU|nr:Hypothetical predicted protein [Octopus vulgaris]
MFLWIAVIACCCNVRRVESVTIVGHLFIASFKAPRARSAVFVTNDSLVDASESKPVSNTTCKSTVKRSYDPSRYPKVIYDVQCDFNHSSQTQCDQATKNIHMLFKKNCEKNICSYDVEVNSVQTACVKKRSPDEIEKDGKIVKFSRDVLLFFNKKAKDDGLEPTGDDEANRFAECQWDWVRHVDDNRFPRVFERAVCKDNERCKPVFKEIVMFVKRPEHGCIGEYCNYEPHIYNEPVACVLK